MNSTVPQDHPKNLKITVWDKDVTKEDDFLGEVKLPVANLVRGNTSLEQWFELQPGKHNKGIPTGAIHLKLKYTQTAPNIPVMPEKFASKYNFFPEIKITDLMFFKQLDK